MYSGVAFYYLAFALLVLVYLFCRWLVRSQYGLVLAGIRQHEARITFFGYRASAYKARCSPSVAPSPDSRAVCSPFTMVLCGQISWVLSPRPRL